MAEQDLQDLFDKYIKDKITPEEFSRLFELVKTNYSAKELDELFRSAFANPKYAQAGNDHDPKEVFAELMAKIEEKEAQPEKHFAPIVVMQPKVKRIRWAVAAAIALCLLGGSWFFLTRQKATVEHLASAPQEQRFKNDVAPGGNKAVLTLGNGSKIILDSAHNGELAKQGATTIEKTDSGKLAYYIQNEKPAEVLYNVLSTPRGGQYELTLPDGTEVWLNAASSIKYPTVFAGKERKVEITGEAYFEVTKNSRMPFIVSVSEMDVQVLGTHFDVNAYTDEPSINTTLLEGSVKVTKGNEKETIKPGEQAQLNPNGKIKIISSTDIAGTMAWKNGKFLFQGANIQTIMKQLVRWYDVDVSFEGNIPDEFVADISRNVEISKMLNLLELTGRVHFIIDGKKVKVIP